MAIKKNQFTWQLTLFQSSPTWFQYVGGCQLEKMLDKATMWS